MPLGEAVVYLRRGVKRRFGSNVTVRLVKEDSLEARRSTWGGERPLPIVVIDGKVFSKGSFSLKAIIQELLRLSN